jgi:starch synthase
MKILFIASEMAPLAQVGGLAEVTASLPRALRDLGHDVRIMLPGYQSINVDNLQVQPPVQNLSIPGLSGSEGVRLETYLTQDQVPVYLVKHKTHFSGEEIYGTNELEKFLFFARAVVGILPGMKWQPQIIHCHDWHTALVPLFIKKEGLPYSTVFTIHNLAYQGGFEYEFMLKHGLTEFWLKAPRGQGNLPYNFMCQGILNADYITTVSPNYAREILTPEYGEGLGIYLRYRSNSLSGIINGLDYDRYNPATDPYLRAHYDFNKLDLKAASKSDLQARMGLTTAAAVPLIGLVQRLDEQKGMDILQPAIPEIASLGAQFVILGKGREHYEEALLQLADNDKGKVAVSIGFDEALARLIYAGCDMFLMPSHFEPCGLGQLIAMRYGSIPIVRHTGGLADTVQQFKDDMTAGNGFVFYDYTAAALLHAVGQALAAFANKALWQKAAKRIMQIDFSWHLSAEKYENVYNKLVGSK